MGRGMCVWGFGLIGMDRVLVRFVEYRVYILLFRRKHTTSLPIPIRRKRLFLYTFFIYLFLYTFVRSLPKSPISLTNVWNSPLSIELALPNCHQSISQPNCHRPHLTHQKKTQPNPTTMADAAVGGGGGGSGGGSWWVGGWVGGPATKVSRRLCQHDSCIEL